jgi:predicted homoserine dehydrogenase-like protein
VSADPESTGRVSLDRLRRIGVIGAGQMGGGIAHSAPSPVMTSS